MKGAIVKDWAAVDFGNKEHVAKFIGAVNHFMRQPQAKEVRQALRSGMQHFATKGNFPDEVMQILDRIHLTTDYDVAYEQIFDIRDFTGTKASGFEIADVQSGLAFGPVPEGQKVKIYSMSGSKVSVAFDLYGGGLNWHKTLFEDGSYWQLEDNAIEFRNEAYSYRSQAFYNLIDAVPSTQNVTWQTALNTNVPNTDASYLPGRDAATMNYAALAMLKSNRNKGTGVTPTTEIILLAPLDLRPRLNMAMTWLQQAFNNSPGLVPFRITPIYTLQLASTSVYYLIIPKRKLKGGYRKDLTLLTAEDILTYADTVTGWMRYGGAIGDVDQVRRCAIS